MATAVINSPSYEAMPDGVIGIDVLWSTDGDYYPPDSYSSPATLTYTVPQETWDAIENGTLLAFTFHVVAAYPSNSPTYSYAPGPSAAKEDWAYIYKTAEQPTFSVTWAFSPHPEWGTYEERFTLDAFYLRLPTFAGGGPSISASPSASVSGSPSASVSASASASASPSASVSASRSATPSASLSATPSASPSGPFSGEAYLFPFAPLVRVPERLQWHTAILKSGDHTEQRIRHVDIPRRHLPYRFPMRSDADFAAAETILHKWLKEEWAVPIWPELVRHTGTLAAGAASIAIDTRYASFFADRYAVIWQDRTHNEVVELDSVADDALTLADGAQYTYTGVKWIVPAFRGVCLTPAGGEHNMAGTGYIDLEFLVTEDTAVTGHAAALTYDGYDVLTAPGYMPGGRRMRRHDGDITIIDAGTGAVEIASPSAFNVTGQDHLFVNDTRAKAWQFRQWLHSIYGPQKPFLVPTFRRDFELTSPVTAVATTIDVANRGYRDHLGAANAMRTYIGLRNAETDTIAVRKVTDIAEISSSVERITIAAAVGAAMPATALCCWVDLCRMAGDTVQIDWYKPGRNTCTADLVRVQG